VVVDVVVWISRTAVRGKTNPERIIYSVCTLVPIYLTLIASCLKSNPC
jgi:hypothetical protein